MKNIFTSQNGMAVMNWISAHWLIILVFVILLLLIFVIIPLISKLVRSHKKTEETKGLKKDLQIWENLASLVRGGEKGREARLKLSTDLKLLTALFKMGIKMIRNAHRKIYDMPWYVILGEPKSGKSTLLENSDAGFLSSASENDLGGQALPLRCWLGAKSYFLDVSGKVFFDRWLEDSSAEWTHFVHLLTKHHGKMPLNGIVLVVPADALLADSLQLTRQKLDLIAAELQQLLVCTGLNLSCQVVITKMDMLTGFREYCHDMDPELRASVFGWENGSIRGTYTKKDFVTYFDHAHEILNDAVGSKQINPEFFRQAEDDLRINSAGKISLFPASFYSLKEKLLLYLDSLFGEANWHGASQLRLSGVFFTSSRDQGVTLSPTFAALNAKKVSECPIMDKEHAEPAFFSKNLFTEQIHRMLPPAFVPRKQFAKDFFTYLVCLLMLSVAVSWFYTPFTKDFALKKSFDSLTLYYQNLGRQLDVTSLQKSPLITYDAKNNAADFMESAQLDGQKDTTRHLFFYDLYSKTQQKIEIPFGFKLQAFLYDFMNQGISGNMRHQIFNEVQHQMVFLPALDVFQQMVIHDKENKPQNAIKKDAMIAYFNFFDKDYQDHVELSRALLVFLLPNCSEDEIPFLLPIPPFSPEFCLQERADRMFDNKTQQTAAILWKNFAKSWSEDSIYPNSTYQRCRSILYAIHDINVSYEKFCELSKKKHQTPAELAQWRKQQSTQVSQYESLIANWIVVANRYEKQNTASYTLKKHKKINPNQYFIEIMQIALPAGDSESRQQFEEDSKMVQRVREYVTTILPKNSSFIHSCMTDAEIKQTINSMEQRKKQEYEKMLALFYEIQNSPFFHPVQQEEMPDQPGTKPMFGIIIDIYRIALQMPPPPDIQDISAFAAAWHELDTSANEVRNRLNSYKKLSQKEPGVQASVDNMLCYVNAQEAVWKKQLAEKFLALCPQSDSMFAAEVKQNKKTELQLPVSKELVDESIGKFDVSPEFYRSTAQHYLKPLEVILSVPVAKGQEPFIMQCKNGREVMQTLQTYTDRYISYWAEFANQLNRKFDDWRSFRAYCAGMKAYEVNTVLQQAYRQSSENLKLIPDAILTPELKKKRDAAVAVLDAKMQILNPHFTYACMRQTANWAALPESALTAYHQISELPEKQLKADYLAVVAAGNKCDIPWWDDLFRNGAEVMKKEAGKLLLSPMQDLSSNWQQFPLCADAAAQPMSREELLNVQRAIRDIGFTAKADPKKNDTGTAAAISFSDLGILPQMEQKTQEWGIQLQIITDAVLNPMKELVWTISVTDRATKEKWTSEKLQNYPDAAFRYRYWDVRMGDTVLAAEKAISEKATVSSALMTGNLEMRFFTNSNDARPSATVRIPGPWAIFRLYLSPDAVYDAEKGLVHVPVFVQNQAGQNLVFWLTLSFNKKLPTPKQWPSMNNWPEFSKVQTNLKNRRAVAETDWNALVNAAKDYDTLVKQLQDFDRGKYPLLSVSFAGTAAHAEFFKYRYMEMQVPGVKTARIQLDRNVKNLGTIPLMASGVRFLFYEHADQQKPSREISIPGTYAPIRLLTAPGRVQDKTGIFVNWSAGDGASLPLSLKLENVR